MKPQTAIIKLRNRLNKIHSSDYDNIMDWVAVEAINKAALEVVRSGIRGINILKEGDEETRVKIDDLQFLLKPIPDFLGNDNNSQFWEAKLPADHLFFKRIIPIAKKGECSNKPIRSDLVEEANVPEYLQDFLRKPSWEWRETFHTLLNNKLRIYKDSQFNIQKVDLVYYRLPKKMDIFGYTHEDGIASTNVDLEFKDDIAEIVIDYAASIIAGDIESPNAAQITAQRTQINI